jgi:AcrR family transcriptional regulator
MRRVATALDTSASALYVYVDSRDDLLAAMFDQVMAPVASPGLPDGDWRERLSALLMTAIGAASGHGGIARVALTTVPDGPHARLIAGRVRDLLIEGGLDRAVIPAALDLLALFVTAAALDRVPATMPERHEEHRQRLRWEIEVILNGLVHTPSL